MIKETTNACLAAGSSKSTFNLKKTAIKKEIDLIVSKIPNMREEDYKRATATIKRLETEGRRFDLDMDFMNSVKQRQKQRRARQIAINKMLEDKSWLTA